MDDPMTRRLAVASFLALVTAAWLPWWVIRYSLEGVEYARVLVFLFRPVEPFSNGWGPHVTGALVAAAALLLFVRVAARSWQHEPAAWRRDLGVAAGLAGVALLSGWLWPGDLPRFWGHRAFDVEGAVTAEAALPGLGWWIALVGAVLAGVAWFRTRRMAATPAVREGTAEQE